MRNIVVAAKLECLGLALLVAGFPRVASELVEFQRFWDAEETKPDVAMDSNVFDAGRSAGHERGAWRRHDHGGQERWGQPGLQRPQRK